jgi:hypothetical protein
MRTVIRKGPLLNPWSRYVLDVAFRESDLHLQCVVIQFAIFIPRAKLEGAFGLAWCRMMQLTSDSDPA